MRNTTLTLDHLLTIAGIVLTAVQIITTLLKDKKQKPPGP